MERGCVEDQPQRAAKSERFQNIHTRRLIC